MDGGFATEDLRQGGGVVRPVPLGTCVQLDAGPRYQVRRHRIEPGGSLPLCHHLHRTEHWTVVQGTVRIMRDGTAQLFSEGQSFLVTLGQTHSVENPGRIPCVLIEVWTGSYLGEDDMIADAPEIAHS